MLTKDTNSAVDQQRISRRR